MIIAPRFLRLAILAAMTVLPLLTQAQPQWTTKEIPEPLRGWEGWATWDDAERRCPSPYQDPAKHLYFWPSLAVIPFVSFTVDEQASAPVEAWTAP